MTRPLVILSLCAVLSIGGARDAQGADVVIVPYGSCGWKYVFGVCGGTASLSLVGLDNGQWATGCTPFVAPWGCSVPGTAWQIFNSTCYGRVVLRRHIFNPGGAATVTYRIRARYAVEAAWNGNGGNGGNLANECPTNFPLVGLESMGV